MLLYRLSKECEVNKILSYRDFDGIGREYLREEDFLFCNNHDYKENEKYLHFFKEKSNLLYLWMDVGEMICTYDIPKEIVDTHTGEGYYTDYFTFTEREVIEECAIPSYLIDFDDLVSVDEITYTIDVDDYLLDPSMKKYTKEYYWNNHPNVYDDKMSNPQI